MLLGKKGWQLVVAAAVSLGFQGCGQSESVMLVRDNEPRAVFDHYGEPMISIDPADGFGGGDLK